MAMPTSFEPEGLGGNWRRHWMPLIGPPQRGSDRCPREQRRPVSSKFRQVSRARHHRRMAPPSEIRPSRGPNTTVDNCCVGVQSLTNGIGATTTAHGKLVFGMFALMAEYEAGLIHERTQAGPRRRPQPRSQGRRKPKMTASSSAKPSGWLPLGDVDLTEARQVV